jgi:R3H domain
MKTTFKRHIAVAVGFQLALTRLDVSLFHICILSIVSIMTSSSPTPDIGSLSLSCQSHQRLHNTYDLDGIQTTPPALPATPSPSLKGNSASNELDLNDPSTLEIYSRILLFKDDHMSVELAFSRTLSPKQRRIVHLVAQKLGVYHYPVRKGDERYAVVTRIDPEKVRS